MRKFQFQLEGVLGYREQVEKEKQLVLTRVHQQVVEHEREHRRMKAELDAAREELRRREGRGEIDVVEVRQQRLHVGALKRQVWTSLDRLRELEEDLARVREEAVKAQKERKVLEMLKARRLANHARQVARIEQAELDDVSSVKEAAKRMVS